MRRTKEDVLAAVAGLTPYDNMHWPSDVGGELGVPIGTGLPKSHPDVKVLWVVWVTMLVGFVLLAAGVTGWVMLAALVASVILLTRASIRSRIAGVRFRRLRAEIEAQRRAAG